MVSFVIPITVLVLCGISTILFVQDTNEHPCRSGIEPPASLSTKPVIAYSCIMVVATFVVSVVFVILFKELDVFATLKRMILLCVIWPLAYIDYKTYRIPNTFILYGLICRAVLIPIELMFNPYFRVDIISELIAAAALFAAALLCAVCMRGSIGAGDMKLFLVMGIFLGLEAIWSAMFLSLLVSFVAVIYLLVTKKKSKKDVIPFGPAIVIGVYLSVCLMGG